MFAGNGSGCSAVGPCGSTKCLEQIYLLLEMSKRVLKSSRLHIFSHFNAYVHWVQFPVMCPLVLVSSPNNFATCSFRYARHGFGNVIK